MAIQITENLKKYFPMIRERSEIQKEIADIPSLWSTFNSWSAEQQEQFLDYCTGVKGVKILYDSFFKEIMNPENASERLNELLSLLLRQNVSICGILPGDSTRIADESSLLIMDILVELEDSSLANVEVQKIGYRFPGQRSACYSADLLLRQYKRIRGEKKKKFSYKDIKSVYTIVFFETSTREFHEFPQDYIHNFSQSSDTGLELELLQKYVFIPLDIFRETHHNIDNKTEAWLTFLSTDSPETIIMLINKYPQFRAMYDEVYTMCSNVEKVMEMFSKELSELDKNTVQYMIDEMQDMIDGQKETISSQQSRLEEQQETISNQQGTIDSQQSQLQETRQLLNEALERISQLEKERYGSEK